MAFASAMLPFPMRIERSRVVVFGTYESRTCKPTIRLLLGWLLLLRMPECLEDILEEVSEGQEDVSEKIFQSQSEVSEE